MKTSHTIGLLLVCMLCRPTLPETIDNNEQDYGDDYEDEDYDYTLEELLNEPDNEATTTTTQTPTTKTTVASINSIPEIFVELPNIIYTCPESCNCNYDFKTINCSMQNFQRVPYNFPDVVEKIDLSRNKIEELGQSDFRNFTNLKELILDDNKLKNISFKDISSLVKLEYLSLVNNHLTNIDPNAFATLTALKTLNLSNNPIEISSRKIATNGNESNREVSSFLNQPSLFELALNGCKVHGVHANMLRNTSRLLALDLGNNTFDEAIDTEAFVPLKSLVKLKLPEVEQNVITELCKTLIAIDAISLPAYDVSCFELESGSSFDDSTIRTSSNVIDHDGNFNLQNSDENKGVVKTSVSRNESAGRRIQKNGEKSINGNEQENSTRRSRPSAMEPSLRNETHTESVLNSTTASTNQQTGDTDDGEDYKVAISSQTINQILIGIIIVAVVGIIIGIICRRDLCGIKTKMCRTRRPAPTDQVRPAEEIPLNKV